MSTHAKLSPSSAVRWLTCPAAPLLEEGKPDTTSEYAAEGTAAHYLAEQCLSVNKDAETWQGDRVLIFSEYQGTYFDHSLDELDFPSDIDYAFDVNEDMVRYVQDYIDLVRDIQQTTNGDLLVEQKLSLEHLTGEKDATGTADAVILTDEQIIIIDLKYGQGNKIFAENNTQLMIYGLAAVEAYSLVGDYESVRLIISQPRLNHVDEWVVSIDELNEFAKRVSNTAKLINTLDEDSDLTDLLNPSQDACRYCKASAECKAQAEYVHKSVAAEFSDLDSPLTVSDATYDNDTLALMFERIGLIEDWIKAVKQATYDKLYAGEAVGDYKLVQGRAGARKWLDTDEAETTLKSMRLKVDEMYNKKLISPTDAEKLNKAGTLGDIQWNKLQDLIVRSEGSPVIAPASDKRPAINTNPVEDFEDIDNNIEA